MTAEVAILNKEAVALAADSAATFEEEGGGGKIFTSVNKIFGLSHNQPVAVMVYGNANLMGVPWETIIKVYRERLGDTRFPTLADYLDDFIQFVVDETTLFPTEGRDDYVRDRLSWFFEHLRGVIEGEVVRRFEELGRVDDDQIKAIVDEAIDTHYELWSEADDLEDLPPNFREEFRRKHRAFITSLRKSIFENLPLDQARKSRLAQFALMLFTKELFDRDYSGVVFAGFGDERAFPELVAIEIEGVVQDFVRYEISEQGGITSHDRSVAIIPFAQREMVVAFMEGIAQEVEGRIVDDVRDLLSSYPRLLLDRIDGIAADRKEQIAERLETLGEEVFDSFRASLEEYKRQSFVRPVLRVVARLPKDELASMAETLVHLTWFKRRVSLQTESVAGPIDVAVISKGDGVVWIKRKLYFDLALNPHFTTRYRSSADG
jgi:hypothetical protein